MNVWKSQAARESRSSMRHQKKKAGELKRSKEHCDKIGWAKESETT
jgi:hypothetical protein